MMTSMITMNDKHISDICVNISTTWQ